jgi:O-antigen ligase
MLELIKRQPGIIVYVVLQYMAVAYGGNSAMFIMPALALGFYAATKKMLYPFITLMILLPLADSTFAFAPIAFNIRPVLLIILTLLVISQHFIHPKTDWSLRAFIPYFIILGYYLLGVSSSSTIFKSLSYILVIVITPVIIKHMMETERNNFLRSLVLIYTLVFVFSFLNIETNASLQGYGRFSGIFFNPNALGIFSFLFFMLTYLIFKFQPHLFTKPERYIVTILILAGVIYSRSRSGIFAILIFWASIYIYGKWKINGIIVAVFILVIMSMVTSFEDIIRGLGLADFFRLETLETGSGRKIAMEEAWMQIQKNPIDGYGIGFTEKFYTENQLAMQKKGHAGGAHNSFLWVWLDMGILGLLTFIWGWFKWFANTYKYTLLILPVGIAVAFSANVESWLMGSLNHVTIQLIIILSLLSSPLFLNLSEQAD